MALRPFWARLKPANIHQMSKKFTRDMLRELFMRVVEDGINIPVGLSSFRACDSTGAYAGLLGKKPFGKFTLTSSIFVTGVAYSSRLNGTTLKLEIQAAAANPTDTVLITLSQSGSTVSIIITPNDGTNNGSTSVNLTSAQLVEVINGNVSGVYDGINCTITDSPGILPLITATGGDATVLAASGEGDDATCTMAGGQAPDNGLLSAVSEPSLVPIGTSLQYDKISWAAGSTAKIKCVVPVSSNLDTDSDITVSLRVSGETTDSIGFSIGVYGGFISTHTITTTTMSGGSATNITATISADNLSAGIYNLCLILTPNTHDNDVLTLLSVRVLGNRT